MKLIYILPVFLFIQLTAKAAPLRDSIPADTADVATPDAIIRALYDVISGGKDVKRNWDRMRTLFKPGAMMVPTGRRKDGVPTGSIISVEEYITIVGPNLEKVGFFEKEIGRVTEQYGNIAHVFSTYESRNQLTDEKPFMRGINSIQMWYDGKRWWILSIFWQGETPDNPIPPKYSGKQPGKNG